MKVYITRYALTKGIQEYDVSDMQKGNYHVVIHEAMYNQHFFKPDWHTDIEEALIQAESMRVKKIESLESKVFDLSLLKFVPKTENL